MPDHKIPDQHIPDVFATRKAIGYILAAMQIGPQQDIFDKARDIIDGLRPPNTELENIREAIDHIESGYTDALTAHVRDAR